MSALSPQPFVRVRLLFQVAVITGNKFPPCARMNIQMLSGANVGSLAVVFCLGTRAVGMN